MNVISVSLANFVSSPFNNPSIFELLKRKVVRNNSFTREDMPRAEVNKWFDKYTVSKLEQAAYI